MWKLNIPQAHIHAVAWASTITASIVYKLEAALHTYSIQCSCSISVENYEFYLFVYVLSSDTGAYVCDSVQMCTCVLVYASECTYIGVVWGRHAAPSFYCLQCSSVVAEHGDQR